MPYPPHTPLGRFGVDTLRAEPTGAVATIPAGGLVNPVTGTPTLAVLAMLVDHACGVVNHLRRGPDRWTVSGELALQLTPEAVEVVAARPDEPVRATARPVGPARDTALAACELTHGATVIGTGSVYSCFIPDPGGHTHTGAEADRPAAAVPDPADLTAVMALRPAAGEAATVLYQLPDPVLNNTLGIVHGGVSASALELAASAALNADRGDAPLRTGSLQVNFLRRFVVGPRSRYVGTVLRAGRGTGVAEAQAVDDDGRTAIAARLTAYR